MSLDQRSDLTSFDAVFDRETPTSWVVRFRGRPIMLQKKLTLLRDVRTRARIAPPAGGAVTVTIPLWLARRERII